MEVDEATFSSDVERIAALLETKKLVILKSWVVPMAVGKRTWPVGLLLEEAFRSKVLQINGQYTSKNFVGSMKLSRKSGLQYWQMSKFAEFLEQPCVILLKNLNNGGEGLADAITDLAAPDRALQMHVECRILGTISSEDIQENLRVLWQDCTLKMESLQRALMASMLKVRTAESGFDNIRPKLLETFTTASELIQTDKRHMDRTLNSKDLIRVVRRLVEDHQQYTSVTDRCALFTELFDNWAAHLAGTESRRSVAGKTKYFSAIGEALSLSTEQQHYQIKVRHPDVSFLEENEGQQRVRIGRITLNRHEQQQSTERKPFVNTRDAAQLLERVAACVARSPPEPVLLTGDTGVGKTAIVQHIAHLLRVPLHVVNLSQESEFTDLVDGHTPTSTTNFLWLTEATERGDWLLLDEINLAPVECMDALVELLDTSSDFIVHANFRLFACMNFSGDGHINKQKALNELDSALPPVHTQNPLATYAGRKRLSRAFLSRFICLKWDALPPGELSEIVQRRCLLTSDMAELMANVLAELSVLCSSGDSSDCLMTVRDLFRWDYSMPALMDGQATTDWRQALAYQGYFVLGTRCRTEQDEKTVLAH
uniref:AAA+ ATPase domain-containing protein n=1 Tax=Globodera rostochiensis TaxID=31243 RepID=A0A914HFI5_GLORO